MKRDIKKKNRLPPELEVRLAVESLLRESLVERNARIDELCEILEQRNAYIRALQEEIRSLRGVVATMNLDPRFWVGFPIGLLERPPSDQNPERRRKAR